MGQSEETQGAEFTPEQVKIVETLRGLQSEITDVKADLVAKLSESRQECDSLYRELSKVRDEIITSKTERRVLSRWYEDIKAERDKLHGELVDVRSALATVSQERDSLRITLDAWEEADTKPVVKEVADHVLLPVVLDGVMVSAFTVSADGGETCNCSTHPHPPCSHCQPSEKKTTEPNQDSDYRAVIPTMEQGMTCEWWCVKDDTRHVRFGYLNGLLHRWAWSHFLATNTLRQTLWSTSTEKFTKPIKPHGMTWQELDKVLADKKAAEVPLCMTCHGCGSPLYQTRPEHGELPVGCRMKTCSRDMTARHSVGPIQRPMQVRNPGAP